MANDHSPFCPQLLLRKKAAEELKKEQERKAAERRRIIEERCGKAKDLDNASEGIYALLQPNSDTLSHFHSDHDQITFTLTLYLYLHLTLSLVLLGQKLINGPEGSIFGNLVLILLLSTHRLAQAGTERLPRSHCQIGGSEV